MQARVTPGDGSERGTPPLGTLCYRGQPATTAPSAVTSAVSAATATRSRWLNSQVTRRGRWIFLQPGRRSTYAPVVSYDLRVVRADGVEDVYAEDYSDPQRPKRYGYLVRPTGILTVYEAHQPPVSTSFGLRIAEYSPTGWLKVEGGFHTSFVLKPSPAPAADEE